MSSDEFVDSGDALVEDESAVYEDEEFDEYSDSFEASSSSSSGTSGGGDGSQVTTAVHPAPGLPVAPRSDWQFVSGDLVQVYWTEEREWLAGRVAQADDALNEQFFVQYDDGEEAWEAGERMRFTPEAFSFRSEAFQQLQLTLPNCSSQDGGDAALLRLHGARVLVYWHESSSWFPGSIVQVDQQGRAFQLEYEDGDLRWEPECDFLNILVLLVSNMASETSVGQAKSHAPSYIAAGADPKAGDLVERVIMPRAYRAAVSDHFKPERTPRPYISVTNTIGSVLAARRVKYSERCYLHYTQQLECTSREGQQCATDEVLSRDCLVQTDIIAVAAWSDNSRDRD